MRLTVYQHITLKSLDIFFCDVKTRDVSLIGYFLQTAGPQTSCFKRLTDIFVTRKTVYIFEDAPCPVTAGAETVHVMTLR